MSYLFAQATITSTIALFLTPFIVVNVAVFLRYLRCFFEKLCLKYKLHRFAYIVRMSSGTEYYLYSPIIKAVCLVN